MYWVTVTPPRKVSLLLAVQESWEETATAKKAKRKGKKPEKRGGEGEDTDFVCVIFCLISLTRLLEESL